MNRRGFLSSLIAVPAAAYVAPNVLATSAPFEYTIATPPEAVRIQRMTDYLDFMAKSPVVDQVTFKRIPLQFDDGAVLRRSDVDNGLNVRRRGLMR